MMEMLLLVAVGMLMHPARQTLCEMEWNAQTGRVEMAIRLSALDEQELLKPFVKNGGLETSVAAEQGVPKILAQRVRFSTTSHFADPDALDWQRYHYVGRKAEGYHVWWFVEVTPPVPGRAPKHVRYALLDVDPKVPDHATAHQSHAQIHNTLLLQTSAGLPSAGLPNAGVTSVELSERNMTAELLWRDGS